MLLLTCKCLNVKIHVKLTKEEFEQLKEESKLNSEDYIPTGFFKSEVEVQLDTKGIKQEHTYLVHRRKHGNYLVFQCLNCGLMSYAMHIAGSPIIASGDMQCDPSVIERCYHSDDFSKVFNIVLVNKDRQIASSMPDPHSATYEAVQSTLNTIQKQLADYIVQEETAMENRIRKFEDGEKEQFKDLQNKLKEEKKKMISLLISAAQLEGKEEKPTRETSKRSTDSKKSPPKKKTVSRVKSMPAPALNEDDPMFEFDGLETSDEPFYRDTSSEGEKDDDDDADHEVFEECVPRGRSKPKLTYSASVPISVPWNTSNRPDQFQDDDDLTPAEPDEIAASMQALAQSITDDNRYIFGDRPRPRLNTGDIHR